MPSTILLFGLLLIYIAMSGRLMGLINITKTLLASDLFKDLGSRLKKEKVIKDGGFSKDEEEEDTSDGSSTTPPDKRMPT